MLNIGWSSEKAEDLRARYGVSFADLAPQIRQGDLLDDLDHHNQQRYPGQRIFMVAFRGYAYAIPYVETQNGVFLKTLYPSRKATRDYLHSEEGDL